MSKTNWVYFVVSAIKDCRPEGDFFELNYAINSQEMINKFHRELKEMRNEERMSIHSIALMDKYEEA